METAQTLSQPGTDAQALLGALTARSHLKIYHCVLAHLGNDGVAGLLLSYLLDRVRRHLWDPADDPEQFESFCHVRFPYDWARIREDLGLDARTTYDALCRLRNNGLVRFWERLTGPRVALQFHALHKILAEGGVL